MTDAGLEIILLSSHLMFVPSKLICFVSLQKGSVKVHPVTEIALFRFPQLQVIDKADNFQIIKLNSLPFHPSLLICWVQDELIKYLSLILLEPILPEGHLTITDLLLYVFIGELSEFCCFAWLCAEGAARSRAVPVMKILLNRGTLFAALNRRCLIDGDL